MKTNLQMAQEYARNSQFVRLCAEGKRVDLDILVSEISALLRRHSEEIVDCLAKTLDVEM